MKLFLADNHVVFVFHTQQNFSQQKQEIFICIYPHAFV